MGCGSPMRKALSATLAGMLLVGVASPASAGAIFPAAIGVVFSPSDPNTIALRTTYGILLSHDAGVHWSYLCFEALGLATEDTFPPPLLTIAESGALISGTGYGLGVSADQGCDWTCQQGALAGANIIDLAVRPSAPHHVVALSVHFPTEADGAYGSPDPRVFETSDDGTSWAPLGTSLPSGMLARSIGVSRSDPSRIYVTAANYDGSVQTAWLLVSTDGGVHWVEKPIAAFDPLAEQEIDVGAVDPYNADVVYLSSQSTLRSGEIRLFVTRDAGDTFSVPNEVVVVLPDGGVSDLSVVRMNVAVSTDGSRVFVGTRQSGLWVASAGDLAFREINPCIDVQCLAMRATARGDELWACSDTAYGGFVAGVSVDQGVTFSPRLSFVTNLAGPIQCGADGGTSLACNATAEGSICKQSWQDSICNKYQDGCPQGPGYTGVGGMCPPDRVPPPGFSADGSVIADAADGRAPADLVTAKCGCSIPGRRTSGAAAFGWLLGALAWKRRRAQKPCSDANRLR